MRVHPSDSLSLQSGKSPLQRSSPAGWSRAGPLCKSHRPISERPVTPRVEYTKPHSLSQPLVVAMASSEYAYEVRPRKDNRGVDLISDALPFGRLWYDTLGHAIGYAIHSSRSHDAVICVYDATDNLIKTHEQAGMDYYIEVGEMLIEAKSQCSHG